MTTQLGTTVQSLREELLAGEFGENGKLQEQKLAEVLDVSRTVIRLALGELEREGLVTREPNKGYRVRSFTIEEVTDAILVRGELEGMAARLCAEKGLKPETLKELRSTLIQFDTLLTSGVGTVEQRIQWVNLNAKFHGTLAKASDNLFLWETIESLSKIPLVSSQAIVFDTHDPTKNLSRLVVAQRDHHDILSAIDNRQGARAESLLKEHARRSAQNKRLGFDAMRQVKHSPALPGLALVRQRSSKSK